MSTAQMFSEDTSESGNLPPFLAGLNPPQREAATHGDGPILVLAGAGSGKTRVLTNRIAYLVTSRGVRPDGIWAVTFTNKAADEMKRRLEALLGDKGRRIWISTFHSSGLRILRHNAHRIGYTNGFAVYDDDDSKSVIKRLIKELNIDDTKNPPASFMRAIDSAKNNGRSPTDLANHGKSLRSDLDAEVYQRYQKELVAANAMDFGDLLLNTLRLLKECPDVLDYYRRSLEYVLVDEFQDTNKIQYEIVRLLSTPRKNLLVVGDDDQSIYAFRGATIRNILEFERDYPGAKVVKLEQNYRSTGTILEAAHAVISQNKERKAKKLWTAAEAGDDIQTFIGGNEDSEAEFIAGEIVRLAAGKRMKFSEFALLYRTNAQTRALEEALIRRGIPYRIFGGLRFYERKEIKDIIGYLRIIANPADNQSFQRVVNTPPRGIGAQALVAINEISQRKAVPYLEASRELAERSKSLAKFVSLMNDLQQAAMSIPLSELIAKIVKDSEYGPRLKEMKDPSAQSRIENLQELESIGRAMEGSGDDNLHTLRLFLDQISLTSGADLPPQEQAKKGEAKVEADTVSLMTLHLAKGLEFPVVFLAGFEEGLLPHYRSITDPPALEEERRLCYVGITRAMRTLYLTRCHYRGMFAGYASTPGSGGYRSVSRFAKDVPSETLVPAAHGANEDVSFLEGFGNGLINDDYSDSGGERYAAYQRRSKPQSSEVKARISAEKIKALLMPADKMADKFKLASPPENYEGKPLATLEEITIGTKVIHPTFGNGIVEQLDGSGIDARIAVSFSDFSEMKKLVFKFSRLVLA